MSAFAELKSVCPGLIDPDAVYETAINNEPLVVLEKPGLMAERIVRTIIAFEGLDEPADNTHIYRLNLLNNRGFLPSLLLPFFHVLNDAFHTVDMTPSAAKMRAALLARLIDRLIIWFVKSYGPHLPPSATTAEDAEGVVKAIRENAPSDTIRRSARKAATRRAHTMRLNEEETRVIIDFQLSAAGWQVDTFALRYSQGARPEKGVNKAISEWITDTGPADYALFAGLDFIGFIEAKKMGKDVVSAGQP